MAQNQILVVTEIKPERAEVLNTWLQQMAKNVNDNTSIPFAKFAELHFAVYSSSLTMHNINRFSFLKATSTDRPNRL